MTGNSEIAALITYELEQHGPCTLEALAHKLPTCSWNQIFMSVDALSRDGALTLQPQARFQYLVSLAPSIKQVLHFDALRSVQRTLSERSGLKREVREANT